MRRAATQDDPLEATVETYRENAEQSAATNADRSAVDFLPEECLDALDCDRILGEAWVPGGNRHGWLPRVSKPSVWALRGPCSRRHEPARAMPDSPRSCGSVVSQETARNEANDDRTDDYDGERHYEYYGVGEFRTAVEAAGFSIVELAYFDRGWMRARAQ